MEKAVASTGRFERKFHIDDLESYEVVQIIKNHPAGFREIYAERFINNIYLDTHSLTSYHENVHGIANRQKARVRWYGDLEGEITKPVLEFKIKRGLIGYKDSYNLDSFNFDNSFSRKVLEATFVSSDISNHQKNVLKSVLPVMINRYNRKYFISNCKRFRVTLDTDLSAGSLNTMSKMNKIRSVHNVRCVVEIKYACEDSDSAPNITALFPYRMTRSSKYVNALDQLDVW